MESGTALSCEPVCLARSLARTHTLIDGRRLSQADVARDDLQTGAVHGVATSLALLLFRFPISEPVCTGPKGGRESAPPAQGQLSADMKADGLRPERSAASLCDVSGETEE